MYIGIALDDMQIDFIKKEAQNPDNVIIIQPSTDLGVKHMEKDLNKVKNMYELGRIDALKILDKLKTFWKNNEK